MAIEHIKEIYCQYEGVVCVSRDDRHCRGCYFDGSGRCPHVNIKFLCELLDIHWEELKEDD